MKLSGNSLILSLVFLFTLFSCGREFTDPHKIPVCVQQDFDVRFPNATRIAWEVEDTGVFKDAYHVSFVRANANHDAFYDRHCTLLQYAFAIDATLAPARISQYIDTQYPESTGRVFAKVYNYSTTKEVLSYAVKLTMPAVVLFFDEQGNYQSSNAY